MPKGLDSRNSVVLEKTESGYSAYLPDLPGCISTGESITDIKYSIREAVEFHIDGMRIEKLPIPEAFARDFGLTFKMDVASLFEWFPGSQE